MIKEAIKRENQRINNNTCHYYRSHKKECSYLNWIARLIAYLDFGKKVYPEPSQKEIEAFKRITGRNKFWGVKKR